ncbi:MAG TPA: cisplatin damage response ATP-dependent DNA ligase, partial [Ohtaekwangia sp.]|uniref:cisplatin damage response ATP-dependent DNA ligase n=1 Tax=Ohtaekwangia sp. TaxID=2066019 RepID=UPI002F93C5A3
MKNFAQLFTDLDRTTKTLGKIKALVEYFQKVSDQDKLWSIALLSHRRPKRTINTTLLGTWASELSGFPPWLFLESYAVVGDLAETITLLLPQPQEVSDESLTYWIDFIRALEPLTIEEKKEKILWAWNRLDHTERFVFNKLITGGFRMGVSQQLMVKALAKHTGTRENVVAHKLMGNWLPDTGSFEELLLSQEQKDISKPYPFYLAYALEDDVNTLGSPDEWYAEHKWDGIRGQIIVRDRQLFVWSRGEELVTDKYPEFTTVLELLPDGTVIDGEILPYKDDHPLSFNHLQTRIGRKTLSAKLLKDVPVSFVTYDILEWQGEDIRHWNMRERRKKIEELCTNPHPVLRLSPLVYFNTWQQLAEERSRARDLFSEGIMLKRKDSAYRNGRRRGDWWKWKIDPFTVDAVMIYAMHGAGRRANLYTDYTFAVWDGDQLVPFT